MIGIVLLVAIVAFGFWFVGVYNSLISLRNQVFNAWKQIDVQLKRRHDLIPNLVETVKGAMNFEKGTLESVIAARNQAIAATSGTTSLPTAGQVQATAAAEGQLSSSLSKLFAVVEAYPDLKATSNVAQLQEELTSTENKIAFARQLYNDQATVYNTRQQQFPGSIVAGFAKATPAELWEITDASEREVVKVDLSLTDKK
ncbi:MAG: LemA family protein [Gemmatimonadaceae bacterium]|nr:LemA family protein [Gemmatimonadaceae bacterium]